MKKRTKLIFIIIFAIGVCLGIWRLWPNRISHLLSFEENSVIGFSAQATVRHYINEYSYNGTDYYLDIPHEQSRNFEDILEIINKSKYQQDFRNLLPGDIDTVHPDKNHDGTNVDLEFVFGNKPDQRINISFLSSSIIAVFVPPESSFRIYHPTNPETIDNLVKYLQTYGTSRAISYP